MPDSLWLSDAQMERIEPYFPPSHGIAWVDNGRVLSGIIHVIRTGMRWRYARAICGHAQVRAPESPVVMFDRIFADIAVQAGVPGILMIDATHLNPQA